MRSRHREADRVYRNAGLLVSLLVRFPEISTVKYDPRNQVIRCNFMVKGPVAAEVYEALSTRLRESLEVYHSLEGRKLETFHFTQQGLGELTELQTERDVFTLTPEEVYLTVDLMREAWGDQLVADGAADYPYEEEFGAQEEYIEQLVADLAANSGRRHLIAFREEGRLVVFNK